MNRRILLASYALISAQMMAEAAAPRPAPTPEPEPPLLDYCGVGEAPSGIGYIDCMTALPVRRLYHEIDQMQAAQNRQARKRAGYKSRR